MDYIQPSQKQKLLILQKILLEKTDDHHSLTVNDIIKELEQYEIKVERKTVYDDVNTLSAFGMDIVIDKKGHSNAYYVGERVFQDVELQLLADAVASSKFLTQKKSNELIKKLQSFTSKFNANHLRRSIYVENRAKTFNEKIYYTINTIHEAIYNKKKISFKYYEYTLEKKKRLKHDGEIYTVSPYYLIWESGYYYLICHSEKHGTLSRFRVDRMTNVDLILEKAKELSQSETDIAKSLRSTYSMFGGESEMVTLELDNSLIDVIIDRYGDGVTIRKASETTFTARIEVQISPPFWGWLFQFGTKAKVIFPPNVVNQASDWLNNLAEIYK